MGLYGSEEGVFIEFDFVGVSSAEGVVEGPEVAPPFVFGLDVDFRVVVGLVPSGVTSMESRWVAV